MVDPMDRLVERPGGGGQASGSWPPRPIAFESWLDPEGGLDVTGDYSRAAWLPTIGPAAWLLWGTVAGRLVRLPRVEVAVGELARAHGLSTGAVPPALDRLVRFGLAATPRAGLWRVRCQCPLLHETVLGRNPARYQAIGTPAAGPRRPQRWVSRHPPRRALRGGQ